MTDMRSFIKALLRARNLTLGDLTEKLGYKSKTSINRIINGNVRPDSVRKFEQTMLAALPLAAEERRQLAEAVQISIYGPEKYHANQAIWDFIRAKDRALTGDNGLELFAAADGRRVDILERYGAAADIRISVVNCQYVTGLFGWIYRLLQRPDVEVEHFIYVNNDDTRTIRAVSALMPVFYEKGYMGYARRQRGIDAGGPDCGFNEADMMFARWRGADGRAHTDVIAFPDARTGVLTEVEPLSDEALRRLGLDRAACQPIKRNYFECAAFEDYIRYSSDYAALERDRAVWKIKPDPGVDQIPANILRRAVQEGTEGADPAFTGVLDRLEAIYRKRCENTFNKRCHAYTVYKRGALYRFAMTGRTTDHFWMMRPYTREERILILTELLNQQLRNPYIHMYLLKDDDAISDVEIACYEHEGMLILDSETDYNLKQGHSEVMITHQRMLNLYRDFFMDVLLQDCVCSEAETCQYLKRLILELQGVRGSPEYREDELPTGSKQ